MGGPFSPSSFFQSFNAGCNNTLAVTYPGIKMHNARDRQGKVSLEKAQERCRNNKSLSVPGTGMWEQHGNHNYSGPEFPSAALRMRYFCEELWIWFLQNREAEERNKLTVSILIWNRYVTHKHWKLWIMWSYKSYWDPKSACLRKRWQ